MLESIFYLCYYDNIIFFTRKGNVKMKFKKLSAILVAFLVAVTSMVLPLSDTFNSVIKTTGSAKAVTKNSLVQHKAIH